MMSTSHPALETTNDGVAASERALVQQALDRRNLVMHYQPIINDQHGIVGVEALARLRISVDPREALVLPSQFIDSIAGSGLLMRLDLQGFALTCHAASLLARDVSTVPYVSCNLSAVTLAMPNLADILLGGLRRSGIAPSQMCLEVTETAVLEAGWQQLRLLSQAGLRIALDNFGSGSCPLPILQKLPLSCVKIDKWFTAALSEPGARYNMALTVLDMAKSLGVDVVVEGVEHSRQWRAARDHGVHTMQGWLHSKAMPLGQLLVMLRDQEEEHTAEAREVVGVGRRTNRLRMASTPRH